jgi:hypothetical protein
MEFAGDSPGPLGMFLALRYMSASPA